MGNRFKTHLDDESEVRGLMTLERIAAEDIEKAKKIKRQEEDKLSHMESIMSDMRRQMKELSV